MFDLILLGCAGIIVLYGSIKLFIKFLARILPFFFKKQIQQLEKERLESIQSLKNMGVEFVSDKENQKNFTGIY